MAREIAIAFNRRVVERKGNRWAIVAGTGGAWTVVVLKQLTAEERPTEATDLPADLLMADGLTNREGIDQIKPKSRKRNKPPA